MSLTFQPTQQIANGVQNAFPVSGALYATFTSDGHLGVYAIGANTWLNIGGPGRLFAADTLGVYGLSPDGTQIWRYTPVSSWTQVFTTAVGMTITQMVSAGGNLYVLTADQSVYAISNGVSTQIGTASDITADLVRLYALNTTRDQVNAYLNGSWTTAIDAGSDTLGQLMAGGTTVGAVGASGTVYLWASGEPSTVTACAPNAQYALTTVVLVGFAGGVEYLYDSSTQNWLMSATSFSDLQLLSGGALVYALSQGGLYILGEYNAWMTNLQIFHGFGQKTLSQICVPGTHDSASYAFPTNVPDAALIPFAMTQGMSIGDQLNAGARSLDIRPQWDATQSDFFLVHGSVQTTVRASDALSQIANFSASNPGEILFVYLNHLYNVTGGTQTVTNFLNNVLSSLGQSLAPPSQFDATSTVASLVTNKTPIIAIIDEPNLPADIASHFWTNAQIKGIDSYADTASVSTLQAYISTTLVANANSASVSLLQCQLTPPDPGSGGVITYLKGQAAQYLQNVIDAFTSPSVWNALKACSPALSIAASESPISLAATSKLPIQQQLAPGNPNVNALNLFIVDFYDTSWTDLAIQNNLARL